MIPPWPQNRLEDIPVQLEGAGGLNTARYTGCMYLSAARSQGDSNKKRRDLR